MKKLALLALLAAFTAAGCSDSSSPTTTAPQTYNGTTVAMGSGTAKSYVALDANGNPSSIGIVMTDSAMENLGTIDQMYMLDIPSQKSETPFDHIMINWNPNGHPPTNVYDKPHFDFHFFTVDEAAQNSVLPGTDTVAFDTTLVPAGYVTDFSSVPAMGVHWSPASDFAPTNTFTKTFIYGSYSGKFYFLEPMVTRAYMMNTMSSTDTIPQPAKYAFPGKYFPTTYTISHDTAAKTYTISFDNMIKR